MEEKCMALDKIQREENIEVLLLGNIEGNIFLVKKGKVGT